MKNAIKLGIFVLLVTLIACSPVRTKKGTNLNKKSGKENTAVVDSTKSKQSSSLSKKGSKKGKETTEKQAEQKGRFNDTTIVDISSEEPVVSNESDTQISLDKELDLAFADAENNNTDKALEKALFLSQTFDKSDSLYFESMFLLGECYTINNELNDAESTFLKIINKKDIPKTVLEKSLIRIGQVYCLKKNEDEAENFFTRLKTEFPKSLYKHLANCESIKQK